MSDDSDDEKTEEPTQKKLDDARKKGQVANSREVNNFFMILALTMAAVMIFPDVFKEANESLQKYLSRAHSLHEQQTLEQLSETIIFDMVDIMALPFLLFIVAALGGSLIQSGFLISAEAIQPKLEKISIKKGLKRMFSSRSVVEFLKGLFKITIVGIIAVLAVYSDLDGLHRVNELNAEELMWFISELSLKIMIGATVAIFLIAIVDFIYQKAQHMKELRMTKQEIKDEHKNQEGDPQVKARLRQLRMERAQQRMMQSVPEADVIVTNPTHYAVALKYDDGEMSAPMVLAMGKDKIAEKIKEIANENDVPEVRNAPLARALHDEAAIGQEIPLDHYQAVAEVISYVYKIKGKKK